MIDHRQATDAVKDDQVHGIGQRGFRVGSEFCHRFSGTGGEGIALDDIGNGQGVKEIRFVIAGNTSTAASEFFRHDRFPHEDARVQHRRATTEEQWAKRAGSVGGFVSENHGREKGPGCSGEGRGHANVSL